METEKFREGDIYQSKYDIGVVSGFLVGKLINGEYKLIKRKEDIKKRFDVGDRITDFCNGYFGRDDYEDKICVAVFDKFAVFQYEDGKGIVLNYPNNRDDFWSMVECWKQKADKRGDNY